MNRYGSRQADKFVVRLPDGMRKQVDEASRVDDRSMNSFIVLAIKEKLERAVRQEAALDALESSARQRINCP